MHIGYVISRYPAVSHTFIQREVLGLRKLGWTVTTISIRRAAVKELLTDADRDLKPRQTQVIVPPGIVVLLMALMHALFVTPGKISANAQLRLASAPSRHSRHALGVLLFCGSVARSSPLPEERHSPSPRSLRQRRLRRRAARLHPECRHLFLHHARSCGVLRYRPPTASLRNPRRVARLCRLHLGFRALAIDEHGRAGALAEIAGGSLRRGPAAV